MNNTSHTINIDDKRDYELITSCPIYLNDISHDTPIWVKTKDILQDPGKYYGMIILLGSQYSLVSKDKLSHNHKNSINYSLFNGFKEVKIIESVYTDKSIYFLISVPSLETYKLLEARFQVEAMSLPEMSDQPSILSEIYHYYMITSILPDGTHKSFSQTVRPLIKQ